MAMNKSRRTSNINNVVQYDTSGNVTIPQIDNANIDTDEFLVSDNGTIKFRTGSEVLSDIGGQGAITLTTTGTTGAATLVGNTLNIPQYVTGAGFVPVGRQLTINGVTYDLSADRTWSITAGVSSVSGTAPINAANVSGAVTISIDQADTDTDGYLSSVDWNTFNGKQPAGSYITALTGEVTAAGPGSVAATISNAAVIAKVLTGLSITGSAITSSDSLLSAMGKLQNQINGLTGSLIYKGSWNAATNTPTINSGVGVAGNFYIVTTPGSTTIDGTSSWAVGDWIIFSGAVWQKVPNTNTVVSVNSYTGAVVLTTDDIAEDASPTNLWFTNARAQAAITGGASSIVTSDLTASRALASNASGKVVVSAVTSTELGYLTGTTSAVQTQIDGKEPTIAAAATDPTLKYWRGDKSWQTLPVYTFNSLSPMTTLGDIIYGGASGAGTRLAGNTTANRRFLRQTGTGTVSAAPAWDGLVSGDIPNNSAEAGSVANSLTFKADGTGAAATVTYNGSTARTISYNSIGAQPASVNLDSLAGLTYGSASAIVRMTAANTFTLDTGNYLALVSQTAAKFLASPTGAAGVPSFRTIVAADIPTLNQNTTGSAATLTTARTLTIGATGKTFDGSADRTWTLAEIGAIGNPMTTLGDIIYGGAAGAVTRLAGSTSSSKRFLTQTGDGTVSAAPAWGSIAAGDVPTLNQNTTGSAATLTTARTFTIGGTGKSFDGSANVSWTLAEVGALSNSSTSTQSGYFGDIYLYDDGTPSHYLQITNSANLTAARILSINVNDANRTISLEGNLTVSAAATVSGTNTGDQTNISGNAATATKLETSRNINGVGFDGSANITITANTPTSLTFNDGGAGATTGTTFNGGTARTISYNTIGAQPLSTNLSSLAGLTFASTSFVKMTAAGTFGLDTNTYLTGNQTVTLTGDVTGSGATSIATTIGAGKVTNTMLAGSINYSKMDSGTVPTWNQNTTGSAATLTTARNINGTSFNGSANITTASWGTARTITIGATGKSVDGSGDVSWSLGEIGAQAAGSYVTTNTYQSITGYKEFASYGSGNKTGFLCNNATTGFMFFQNVSTGKTWDWEILSDGTINLNESGVSARFMLYAGGGGRVFGNLTANGFFESSDIRYKEVLHTNPVVDLSSIEVIKYRFTDDLSGQVRYGYSAQDVQSVCADLVSEKDERLYLNYSDVHTLKIAALEKEIKELKLKLGI